jgi:hypothetical protein
LNLRQDSGIKKIHKAIGAAFLKKSAFRRRSIVTAFAKDAYFSVIQVQELGIGTIE